MKYEFIGDKIKITINGTLRVLRQGEIIDCDANDIQGNPNFVVFIDKNKKLGKLGGK